MCSPNAHEHGGPVDCASVYTRYTSNTKEENCFLTFGTNNLKTHKKQAKANYLFIEVISSPLFIYHLSETQTNSANRTSIQPLVHHCCVSDTQSIQQQWAFLIEVMTSSFGK